MLDGYRRILETIYCPDEYFERASAFLLQLGASAPSPIVFSDPMAVTRPYGNRGYTAITAQSAGNS